MRKSTLNSTPLLRHITALLILCSMHLQIQAQECDCGEALAFLNKKIAQNYSGFKDKVTSYNQNEFNKYNLRWERMADTIRTDTACLTLLRNWTKWFKDGHIQLSMYAPPPEELRRRYANWEKIPVSEAKLRHNWQNGTVKPIEGIWEDQGKNYTCAILPNRNRKKNRDYAAVVLQGDSSWWMPGQVKFELLSTAQNNQYQVNYYMRNHSLRKIKGELNNGVLQLQGLGPWRQVFPDSVPPLPGGPATERYTMRELDEHTLLLTIPTMNADYRQDFKKLIKDKKALLATRPNLIIDCRNNGGGSDITYFPLRPYLYTKPVISYYMQTYSTKDNNQKYFELAKDKRYPLHIRLAYKKKAKKLERNLGKYVGRSGFYRRKVKKKKKAPANVAILINGGCASSCEQFVLFAQQSDKVTLIGQNTAGINDYGNLHSLDFPGKRFRLSYPTTRYTSLEVGKGIDNIGIAPRIRLEESEDWVRFAHNFLKRKQEDSHAEAP